MTSGLSSSAQRSCSYCCQIKLSRKSVSKTCQQNWRRQKLCRKPPWPYFGLHKRSRSLLRFRSVHHWVFSWLASQFRPHFVNLTGILNSIVASIIFFKSFKFFRFYLFVLISTNWWLKDRIGFFDKFGLSHLGKLYKINFGS